MELERINPMTNQTASKAPAMTPEEASDVADRAAKGFVGWSVMGPECTPGAADECGRRSRSAQG